MISTDFKKEEQYVNIQHLEQPILVSYITLFFKIYIFELP